jgi:hypothetical protein
MQEFQGDDTLPQCFDVLHILFSLNCLIPPWGGLDTPLMKLQKDII